MLQTKKLQDLRIDEVAVELDGSREVAVAEHAVVHLGAELAHLGAFVFAGQGVNLVVEGLHLLGHREVLVGGDDGAVGDAQTIGCLGRQDVPQLVSGDMPDPSVGDQPVQRRCATAAGDRRLLSISSRS